MIDTLIFDMDGLIFDNEQLWGESMKKIAGENNIPITADRFSETTGLKIHEVTQYWEIHFPWQGNTPAVVAEAILDDIIDRSKAKATIMPGVLNLIKIGQENHLKIGLASSSALRMIEALLIHFNLKHFFQEIVSADFVALGKPHPAVFLECASRLGSSPLNCLVLEDSLNGVIAGKAARMKVFAIPQPFYYNRRKFSIADKTFRSLQDIGIREIQS